jgi:GTP cyclohydrolase II
MSERPTSTRPDGARALVAVDRAAHELRRGRPVIIAGAAESALALAAEYLSDGALAELRRLTAAQPALALSEHRASVLHIGPTGHDTILVPLTAAMTASAARDVADPRADLDRPLQGPFARIKAPPPESARAAVGLCKWAGLLPAAVVAAVDDAPGLSRQHDFLTIAAADAAGARQPERQALRQVASARLPIDGAENSRIHAFRPADGGVEHLAMIIGDPPRGQAVLARLHSQCFTGDVLGSLRCDCGQQLQGALAMIAKGGGGVLLYMAEEGRGIGLINKLRAYELQDQGIDTFEANLRLGFAADERMFEPAAGMLRQLGFRQLRLITNNPDKVTALGRCGIEVAERIPHAFPPNNHNQAYLAAKKRHSGHYL